MVMMLEPLVKTLRELETERGGAGRIIMLAAAGKPLTQSLARELAREETLTLVCGRYEGIDARLMDILPVEQVSVGEAVLNGGEAAAMMLVEAATRLIPGFMGKRNPETTKVFRRACWSIRTSRGPKSLRMCPCRMCCVRAIMAVLPSGGASSRCGRRCGSGPTCWTGRR